MGVNLRQALTALVIISGGSVLLNSALSLGTASRLVLRPV